MKATTKDWIGGGLSAIMGAIAPAIPVTYIAPEKFNLHEGLQNLVVLCLYPVITAVSAYLYKRPLPGIEEMVPASPIIRVQPPEDAGRPIASGQATLVILALLAAAAAVTLSACITPS